MVAFYVRQSIDKKDSISIEDQIEKCKKEIDNEEYAVYSDKGYSGKSIDRPQFLRLLNDVETGFISKVVVYRIDRISRAILDFGKIMEAFEKHNVEFVSHTEKFDTSTPIGRAMLNIIMVFAQLERETIGQRIKDNYYSRGRQGFYLGGAAPFGFDKVKTSYKGKKTYAFSNNPAQAAIVYNLFNEYANTEISLGKLAQKLTAQGIKTNSGKVWGSVSLGRTLRNPVYVAADMQVYLYLKDKGAQINNDISEFVGQNGCYLYAQRSGVTKSKFSDLSTSFVTIALHKGIIPAELWLKCQYKLDKNKQIKNSGKGGHSWLSGLVKCGYCGYAINVVNNSRGKNYINCGGRKQKICNERKRALKIEEIEKIVEFQLLKRIEKIEDKGVLEASQNSAEINRLNIELYKIDEKIKNLVKRLCEANDVTMKYINQALCDLEKQKDMITADIMNIKSQASGGKKTNINLEDFAYNWDNYSIEERKILAGVFIKRVTIKDDEIKILFF